MAARNNNGKGTRVRPQQGRFWLGTENNPDAESSFSKLRGEQTLPEGVSYVAFQLEKGEKGTPHHQIYIEFKRGRDLSWIRGHICECHWERRKGTAKEASDYCTKSDTRIDGPWIIGTMSLGRGRRSDLVEFKDAIKSGKRKRELWETHTIQMAKFRHMYNDINTEYPPKRKKHRDLEVCLFLGVTGCGKTRYVFKRWKHKRFWSMPFISGRSWFDGYDKHHRVLMDDFAGKMSKMPLILLLWVLDRYPRSLEVKGSFTWWLPTQIAITTNYHPSEWYNWQNREKSYAALMRRFTQVVKFDEDGNPYQANLKDFKNTPPVINGTYYKHKPCTNCH